MKQQKVQAILMATNKDSRIQRNKHGKLFFSQDDLRYADCENLDLIIISDEIPDDGDYSIDDNGLFGPIERNDIPVGKWKGKILSLTDESLGLPAPDNKSIQYIIDEFNSGKTEVYGVVDFEITPNIHVNTHLDGSVRNAVHSHKEIIKTNPYNTISIKPAYLNEDLHIKWWNSIDDEHKEIIAAEYFKFPITPPFPKEDLYVCNYRDLSNDVINYIFRNLKVNIDKFILDSENEGNRYEYGYGMDLEYIKKSLNIFDNTISIKPIEESWDDVFDNFIKQAAIVTAESYIKWLKQNYSVPTKLK